MAEPLETEVRVVGADRFIQDLSECYQAIMKTGEVSEETARRIREARAPINAMSRSISGMRATYRMQHVEMLESIRLMKRVGYVGYGIVNMWQAWNIAQMRVSHVQQSYRQATANVAILQDELNRLQQQGITTGEEYINVQIRLNQAKAEAKRASQDLAHAQQENIVGYVGMGMQVMGFIGNLAQLHQSYVIMQGMHGTTIGLLGAETVARYATAAATWIQAKAQATLTALTPFVGPFLVAAGIAAAATAVAWMEQQRSMQKGGTVEETGLYYLHRGEYVIPPRSQALRSVQITNNIYGATSPEETAREIERKTVNALRRRGVI